jgi:Domain of unknown function (DUF4126)
MTIVYSMNEILSWLTANTQSIGTDFTDNKMQWLISLGLGISLAACCGLRVFLPFLIASFAAKMGWYTPTGSFAWIGSTTALVCFSFASLLEITGYMIPYFDHLLDAAGAPIAMIAGAVMSASIFGIGDFLNETPIVKVILGILVGGGTAGAIQGTTSLLRLGSTKLTGGLGNPLFAKVETALALLISLISFWIPLIVAAFMVGIVVLLFYLAYKKFYTKSKTTTPTTPKE